MDFPFALPETRRCEPEILACEVLPVAAALAVARLDTAEAARAQVADGAAMDRDEPAAPVSAVTFGRGLDLQGTPIRLVGQPLNPLPYL